VTDLLTEVNMTVTEAAGPALSAGVTTASSSELTSTPRTTAVSSQTGVEVGASGASLEPAARVVVLGDGAVTDTVKVQAVLTPLSHRRGSVTLSLAEISSPA